MRRTPIKPVSDRRRKRDAGYRDACRKVWARAEGRCEAITGMRCTGRHEHTHHIAGRVGPDPHAIAGLLAVCLPCHDYIHAHPAVSYEHGWMRKRNRGNQHEA